MRTEQSEDSLTMYADEDSDFGIIVALATALNLRIDFDTETKEYSIVISKGN